MRPDCFCFCWCRERRDCAKQAMGAHLVTEEPIQSTGLSSGGGLESQCELLVDGTATALSVMEHPSVDDQQQQQQQQEQQQQQQQQQQGGHRCQVKKCGQGVLTDDDAE